MSVPVTPWLSLIGLGEDGVLSPAAQVLVAQARLVVGGRRHLALAGPFRAETLAWPSPLGDAFPAILARRGEPVCVLASGDPFFHGVGPLLAAHVAPGEMHCLPAPSSLALAAARLGWAGQDCRAVSLHGRDLRLVIPHLQPGGRVLCLTWDGTTPAMLAVLLRERGMGGSTMHVMEALGGPRERLRRASADGFALADVDPLNIVALDVACAPGALTLSALQPMRGHHLWDIGAGSGSISVEWMLRDPANRATAVEARADRAARIAANAGSFGVPGLAIVTGRAPTALAGLPRPDAVFIGGGAGDPSVVEAAWDALPPGGRLVVNAVTLETQAALVAHHAARGGELIQVAVSRAEAVGPYRGWRPAMPITQWAVTKR